MHPLLISERLHFFTTNYELGVPRKLITTKIAQFSSFYREKLSRPFFNVVCIQIHYAGQSRIGCTALRLHDKICFVNNEQSTNMVRKSCKDFLCTFCTLKAFKQVFIQYLFTA